MDAGACAAGRSSYSAPTMPINNQTAGPPSHMTPILAATMNPRIHMMLMQVT